MKEDNTLPTPLNHNEPLLLDVAFSQVFSYATWQAALHDSNSPWGENFMAVWTLRGAYIRRCGFPIITEELLDTLAGLLNGKRVADIGCGTGYLTYHLHRRGVNITGFDNRIKDNHYFPNLEIQYISTVKGIVVHQDYREIDPDDHDVFIISWPDYTCSEGSEFLTNLPVGKTVIYQGEGQGGCCADDHFFDILDEDFTLLHQETKALQQFGLQFHGIHDKWEVYRKQRHTLDRE